MPFSIAGVYAFGFLFMLPQLFVNYKVSIYWYIMSELIVDKHFFSLVYKIVRIRKRKRLPVTS